ncbi:MAG: hypothetical protein ACXWUN_02140 [Allosphingosinicella sp.]
MNDLARIASELDFLEKVQADLATIATRTDERRRHDLIELRRQLSQQIAQVGRVADPIFSSDAGAELIQEYRSLFSKMRSMAAIHQANWPAVRLGESPEEYQKSALGVREANREFVAWMRDALVRLRAAHAANRSAGSQ